jgi:ribonucleoside-triphosphate reductase (formate)
MRVEKRDGRKVLFKKNKIVEAIQNAFLEVDGEISETSFSIATNIANFIEHKDTDMTVEEIQDIVENKLMASRRKDVAKAYIVYREKRNIEREKRSSLINTVAEKLTASNVQNQNANVDESSFGGRMGEANSALMRKYALDYCLSDMAKNNHLNNEIYIHDLDHYAIGDHNCLSIPFDDLLANGFRTRQTDVRPAGSVSTAFQLVAVIFQLQSLQQFGGVSATHLDWTMVPYVRKSFYKHYRDGMKYICGVDNWNLDDLIEDAEEDEGIQSIIDIAIDNYGFYENELNEWYDYPAVYQYAMDMTTREIKQAVEGMYHNLNTLQSRSGNQLPFTSINYGTCTLTEGRMITKALLEGSLDGVGKLHKTSIFPCGIFQCMNGVNRKQGDPNYDLFQLALKSTAKRLYPNYANCDWSGNEGYDKNDPRTFFSTMGCRTANGYDINGFGQLKDGRGNICPVTIILPTLAMEANGNIEEFMTLLDTKIHEAKDMLIERFNWICSQSSDGAKFMYDNNVMAGYVPKEGVKSALKHGTIVIGQLGLAETLQILVGCDHTEEKGMELAKRIEELFNTRCKEFKEQYKLNFGVYYTPAENLCYTAMKKFKARYGIIPNVSDREYFTNSMHIPVWKKVTAYDKISLESQLTGYSNAGCITYVEFDTAALQNIEALEKIVNFAMDKDIPYFAINVPNDTCLNCGYTGVFNENCPMCGSTNIQQLRRVTGYLTTDYHNFNKGKQAEVLDRVKHSKYTEFLKENPNELQ